MKKWDIQKLVVSTFVFLVTAMGTSGFAAEMATVDSVEDTVKATSVSFVKAAMDAPYVRMSTPKVAKMDSMGDDDSLGSRVFVRDVDDSTMITDALLKMPLTMSDELASTTDQGYSGEEGAFVSLGDSQLMKGLMNVDNINPDVGKRVAALMDNPDDYGIDSSKLDVKLAPKLVEVATLSKDKTMHKSHLLAMDPTLDSDTLTKDGLSTLLTRAYSAFKGYSEIVKHRTVAAAVEINTGMWAADQAPEMTGATTAIQMIAAQLAGVDSLVFHEAGDNAQAIDEAREFLSTHQGQSVSDILDQLVIKYGGK